MGGLFGIFDDDTETKKENRDDDGKLLLREEKLDVAKDRVQTGEVTLGKEIIEEQQVVNVPVGHEEVVIERRALNHEPSDEPVSAEETIRIPVSEEQVKVDKHTELTGEVSAYKREVEETREIEETLKREEARIDKKGDPNIINSRLH